MKFLKFTKLSVIILALFLFNLALIPPLSFEGRIFGVGDASIWESLGLFFRNSIHFSPYPWVHFQSKSFLFPYGFTNVMQSWGLEREYLNMLMTTVFGEGPWLQLYFLLSLNLTVLGLFFVFRKIILFRWALFFSLLTVASNAYLFFRYPAHLNIAVAHWSLIGIATDFYLCHNWFLHSKLSLNALVVRIFLLFACLGLDLTYIAGYSLFSFSLTSVWIGYSILRNPTNRRGIRKLLIFPTSRWQILGLSLSFCMIAILSFLYMPLIIDILITSQPFVVPQVSAYWVNPLHLFHPWIYGIDPLSLGSSMTSFLRDHPEGPGDFNPGFAIFLGGAAATFFLARTRRIKIILPFVAVFLICVLHHPSSFNLLTVMPWFKYQRVPSRSTLFFPLLLILPVVTVFSLGLERIFFLHSKVTRYLTVSLGILLFTEIGTQFYLHSRVRTFEVEQSLSNYFSVINSSPGAALLDFPFCVSGGNGVGTDKYCPSFDKLSVSAGLGVWHGKSVLDVYAGRLHPNQLVNLKDAGFDIIMRHFFQPNGLEHCLSDDEWAFLDRFFTENDFSGIQVIEDFFPQSCKMELYRRFGDPVARAILPLAGPVSFVQKDPLRKKKLNPSDGLLVSFEQSTVGWKKIDLLQPVLPSGISVSGLEIADFDTHLAPNSRVSRSDCVEFSFFATEKYPALFTYEFENRVPLQATTLMLNDVILRSENWKEMFEKKAFSQHFDFKKGGNSLSICHKKRMNFRTLLLSECSIKGFRCIFNINEYLNVYHQNKGWAGVYSELSVQKN